MLTVVTAKFPEERRDLICILFFLQKNHLPTWFNVIDVYLCLILHPSVTHFTALIDR